ncbi:MAG: hypothetical protein IJC82_05900, partial [Firmicutes bacterium]|nr:hypothetical protein [Bacillota bacterium]
MNRTALKNFAEWAREMLLADVGTESASYAWFSRIIALRYMAVNGYLPVGIELSSVEDDLILKENVFKGCDFLTS